MATPNDRRVLNCIFNQLSPFEEQTSDDWQQHGPDDEVEEECEEVAALQKEGVRLAEGGHLAEAIRLFTQAIQLAPNSSAAYNNRAQALRLNGDIDAALRDLDRCLEETGGGRAHVQALCQRALVHHVMGQGDRAYRDMQMAASMGSQFAKSTLPKLNPYSALCNQMLREVMDKLRAGQ